MWNLVFSAFIAYIEKHPEVIEQAVEQLVKFLLAELAKVNAPK